MNHVFGLQGTRLLNNASDGTQSRNPGLNVSALLRFFLDCSRGPKAQAAEAAERPALVFGGFLHWLFTIYTRL